MKPITLKQLTQKGYTEYAPGKFARVKKGEIKLPSNKKSAPKHPKEPKIDLFPILVKQELGIELVTEHKFHPIVGWRFDYALPDKKIAVEREGGIWRKGGGAHSRPANIIRDMEKYTEAAVMGWVVIRRTVQNLQSNETLELIRRALVAFDKRSEVVERIDE